MRAASTCLLVLVACGGGGDDDGGGGSADASANVDAHPGGGDGGESGIDAGDGDDTDAGPGGASRVWVVGDFLTDNRRQAGAFLDDAVLPFGPGSEPPLLVPDGASDELFDGSGSTSGAFHARGDRIAYVADDTMAGRFDLVVAGADGSSPTILVEGGTPDVDITAVSLSPDRTKVAFVMDGAEVDNGNDLYVVPVAGGEPTRVSPDRPDAAPSPDALDVSQEMRWSPDSVWLAFSGDLTENAFDQLYLVDTTDDTPQAIEVLEHADIADQTTGPQGVRVPFEFDGDNDLFFRARLELDGLTELFVADTTGDRTAVDLPARADLSVAEAGPFGITPDGDTLVFAADAPEAETFQLYAQATDAPAAPEQLTDVAAIEGEILRPDFTSPLAFSSSGARVAVLANWLSGGDNAFEPFVVELDGSGQARLVAIANSSSKDTEKLVWSRDGATLYALGDYTANNDAELYALDPDATDQTPTLAVDVASGGDLVNVLVVAP